MRSISFVRVVTFVVALCAGLALSAGSASAQDCQVPCGPGFLCYQGQCVSACNPPCGPGYMCTAQAQCVPAQPQQQPQQYQQQPQQYQGQPQQQYQGQPQQQYQGQPQQYGQQQQYQGQYQAHGQVQMQPQAQYSGQMQPMQYGQQQPVTAERQQQLDDAASAHFNFGRYIVEVLVGGLAGGLGGYAGYVLVCGDEPCLGGLLLGLTFNVVATPAGVTLIGGAMGGMGNYLDALLGGLVAFAGAGAGTDDETAVLALTIGIALSPFTSALIYELFSGMRANQIEMGLAAIPGENGLAGGTLSVGGRF